MQIARILALVPLVCFAPACSTLDHHDEASTSLEKGADKKGGDKKKDDDEKALKIAKAEHALDNAKAEERIAKLEVQAAERKADDEVAEAQHGAQRAAEALEHFVEKEKPLTLAQLQLGIDTAAWRLEEQKQELSELQAMYNKDEVAKLTKELVLQRGQKGVEFATRNLEQEQSEAAMKRDFELPRKQRELEQDKREADAKLREARASKERGVEENALKLRKAAQSVEDAEHDLAKAKSGKGEES